VVLVTLMEVVVYVSLPVRVRLVLVVDTADVVVPLVSVVVVFVLLVSVAVV
jgi:hypothetical protein